MKAIIPSVIAISLMIGVQSVYASPLVGFNAGVKDAQTSDTTQWYILQPGNGFAFHTKQFVEDYIRGFCSINPQESSDAEQASWDCAQGPTSGSYIAEGQADQQMQSYTQGYKVGYNDGLTGVYHRLKAEDNAPDAFWGSGYTSGWDKGCIHSGRTSDDCDSQADANTP